MLDATILILAAGEGKRMKSRLPKVLHEICSKPMIRYVLDVVKALKPKKIVVVVGKERLQVKHILEKSIKIAYQSKPKGTADAVKAAKPEIVKSSKDIIILYGDTPLITQQTITTLYDVHKTQSASCTILTTFLKNPKGYGRILRNEVGAIIGVIEEKDADFQQKFIREVNTGIYCFKRDDLLNALNRVGNANKSGEYYLTDVIPWLLRRNKKVCATLVEASDEVLGVNSQMELAHAAKIIRSRILEQYMEAGAKIMDPQTTFIDASAKIGSGTLIFPFTFIEEDVEIGKDCRVGPFCHLRPGVVLKDKVSVGNFAEIKNSSLGQGTNMRHMSYLGDTHVGEKVNIGAGTVVANFDGKKKNKTVIKDKAFVGCDSVLIAPITIGKGAVIGAGSVITKHHNVHDGATVVGVPAREIKRVKKKVRP